MSVCPRNLYKDHGSFGVVYRGTAAQLALIPSAVWVLTEGDLWYDTTNNCLKVYTGTAWVQIGAMSVSVTAADAGAAIPEGATFAAVDADSDANHIVILPSPIPGTVVYIAETGTTGFELRSSAPATVGINAGTGASAESAIAGATTLVRCVCVSATNWVCSQFDADGDESKVTAAA